MERLPICGGMTAASGIKSTPYVADVEHELPPHPAFLTVRELLEGKEIAYPHVTGTTFKKRSTFNRIPVYSHALKGA